MLGVAYLFLSMNLKRQLIIFTFIFILGSILGLLGIVDFNATNKMAFFWPGTVIQSIAGIFFGMTGVLAGVAFPIFSDGISGLTFVKILIWTPANFIQSFIPFLTKKLFKFDPYTFNKKTIWCFIIGCAIVPHLLGALLASFGYYFFHEITGKEYLSILLNWLKSNVPASIIFGLLLLKFFAPALKECSIYDTHKPRLKSNDRQYSLPIKILLVMLIGTIGPILLLMLYEFIRFHEVLFGRGDILTVVYACSILLSLAFVGYIVCEVTIPIKTLIANIEAYRLKKTRPALRGITNVEEFNYLFSEYEKLIKEIERYEIELINKTTLAAIGSMATMVAHDVRKPLTAVQMFLQALPEIKHDYKLTTKLIKDIKESITHTNTMLNDILEFSHEEPPLDLKVSNLQNVIVKAIYEVFRINSLSINVNFLYDFKHGLRNIYIDELRIIRVLINLLANSIEAMASNNQIQGNISFRTKVLEKNNETIIMLTITDDGPGIPQEALSKIYNPFFSYAKKGGNGLGLAICKNIMLAHQGDINVKNREDKGGVEVDILFPSVRQESNEETLSLIAKSQDLKTNIEDVQECYLAHKSVSGQGISIRDDSSYLSVLLVDDEKIVRTLLHNSISSFFEDNRVRMIAEASSAEEALFLLKENSFSHVITDIDFGKGCMDGYDLAKQILKQYKNISLVIHSNKRSPCKDEEIKRISGGKFWGFIQKPITNEHLLSFLSVSTDKRKNALLLNDDKTISFSMKRILDHYNIDTTLTTCVEEALASFLHNTYDFILSDVNLGSNQESGYVFLEKVRVLNKVIPFIIMSGYNEKSEQEKIRTLGATAYIQTPFEIEDLLKVLPR